MKHECHWPSCSKEVPPSMWGCKKHWFKLPKAIRDRIWQTYRPGQEDDKNPSPDYWEVVTDANTWAENYELQHGQM